MALAKALSRFGEVFGNCGNDQNYMEQIEAMEVPKRVRAYCGLLLLVYIENVIILAILQSR